MIPQQTFENYPVFGDNATKVKPDDAKYAAGFQANDVLPAEWMNWAWNKNTKGITDLNEGTGSMEAELINVLDEAGITPSGSASNQVYKAIRNNCGCIIASSKTITDAPSIESNNIVKIMFTADITGSDTTSGMTISYNGTSYPVKATRNGSLVDFKAHTISGNTKYLQANTIMEFVYDGANFVIIGNPVVLSGPLYKVYANGTIGDEAVATVKTWASTTIPYGWEICNGQALSRTVYADLFSVIGTIYGAGDGSTTFNVPDYRECALVGIGTNQKDTIEVHDVYTLSEFKDDCLQLHVHTYSVPNRAKYGQLKNPGDIYGDNFLTNYNTSDPPNARTGTVTRGKRKGVYFLIKVK